MGRLLYERAKGRMKDHWPIEPGDITPWKYFLVVAVVLGLILGLSAPDSDDIPGWLSMAMWIVQSLLTVGTLLLVHRLVQAAGIPKKGQDITQLITSGVITVLVLSPPLLGLDILLGENSFPVNTQTTVLALAEEMLGMGPPVIVAWLAMNAPFLAGFRLVNMPKEKTAKNVSTPPFMELVDPRKRGQLLSLTAELHYLRVATDAGNSLILYNLRDAVSELAEDQGIQCHRSHWVALDAIESFRKQGRQGTLRLINEDKIPVSRSQLNSVESVLSEKRP